MGWFDFLRKKKNDEAGVPRVPEMVLPTSPLKSSLLSLEQRLMFDAAAAATAAEVAGEAVAQEQADAAVAPEGESESLETDSGEGQEVVQALTTFLPAESPSEIVFVDPTVPDYHTLLAGMDPHIEVVMLDAGKDGIGQMANALAGRTGLDAIHIISHGDAGQLHLGTGLLTTESMSGHYANELTVIQQALSEQADILVYGCDFAAGDIGQTAVDRLSQLTGADVEASNDLTGHASLGGDWDLEVRTGAIEARIAVDVQAQANWVSLLAAPVLDATRSPTLSAVTEDAGAPSGSVGTLVSSLVDFATPSGQVDNVTDADSGAQLGIAITAANTSNGTWWFSTNNGSTWAVLGSVSDASARLLAADADTRVYFQANANYNGSVSDAITFHAWDQTSGTNGGTASLVSISTVSDQFSAVSYSNNDGTVKWGGSWQELGETDGSGSGMVVVNSYAGLAGNSLQIETDFLARGASRQVDLSGTTAATLSFDYIRQHGGGTKGAVSVDVYNGKTWTTLQTLAIDATDAKAQSVTVDISAYANANTQIRFIVTGSDTLGRLHLDNIEVTGTATGGGTTAYSSASDTAALTITSVNDAPVFVPHGLIYNTTEGAAPITSAVSALIGTSVTDVDSGALSGVAIFGMTGSGGTLEYSLDGNTWSSVGSLSSSNALLLRSTDQVRFTPDRDNGGTIQVSYRAWDQTSGSAGSMVDVSVNGGATAFSSATDVVTCSIASVNDAPVLADTALILTVVEDAGAPTGAVGSTVSALTGGLTDVDSGAIKGLAITGTNETNGTWYYTTNGGSTWTAVGTVSTTSALLLADNANTRLYFAPQADYNGTSAGAMTIRGWDQTSGTAGTKVSTASNGGTTAFSSATDTIDVTVTPVNDAPTDLSLSANTVAENTATGTVVGTVSGTDPDSGDTKSYSFTDSAGGRFAIHSSTGVIAVADASLLNYESATSHNVTVRVTDAGGLTYDETFTVAITNVNEAPVAVEDRAGLRFDGVDDFVEMGSGTVYEVTDTVTMEAWINREPSSQATQIIINKEGEYEVGLDADGSLKWAFANTNPGWAWHDTGVVIPEHTWTHIAVTYDHGTITSYVDGVVVETFAGSGTIGDANPPKDTLRIGGRENNPANQYFAGQISEVQVWNVARTAGEIVSDRSGSLGGTETGLLGYWKFNENAGTNADNLAGNSDGMLGGGSAAQTPQWATYRVSEDNTLTVTGPGVLGNDYDVDGDALSAVMVTGPSHASSFTLNPDGSFSYTPAVDFSGTDSFTYRVSDGSTLSNIATVHIQVDPVNDAPTDLSLSANTVAENAANGTVVGTVSGTDPDSGDTKSYSFTDSAGGRFAIHSSTGVITVADGSLLNYEFATSHSVMVRVTDGGGLTYDEAFTINLIDVNEATPTITSNAGGATATIRVNENIAAVTTVTASDGDTRQTLTYSIAGGADASKFTIDSNTGVLRFMTAPDYEAPTDSGPNNIYDVTVQVSDNSGGVDTQALAVTVSNVNEAPTDLSLSASTVAENAANGTVVGTITGTDVDAGDTKAYSFTDSAGGRFAINRTTGVITVANGTLLNYEAATSHAVTVRVTDRGGLTYDETFTINLTNVNEAPAGTNTMVTINEDTAQTFTPAHFGFSDVDAGDTLSAVRIDTLPVAGTLTLSGVAVSAGQVVSVADVTAGNLVFTPVANANGAGYARITFSVRDSNNAYDATPNTLTVNVTAVNDAPTDLALSANTVAENAANGTVVGTITGTDVDAGDTKAYSFTDSAGGRFAINSSTGAITVANSTLLNYETATSHNVTVRVTDRGGLTYNETFTINLTNVNEAPTNIALSGNTVAENSPTGTVVGAASTTDPDAGDRHTYSLTNNAGGRFAIDGTTGQITVANGSLLNYDVAASHTITVRTTDIGGLTRSQTFTINLTNINEAPTDLALSASRVAENATNGTVVGTVSGTDPDSGDTKSYSLTDNAAGRFAINAGTGVITVANGSLLDYEAAAAHSVTVRVTDAGGLTYDETFSITVTNVNEAPTDLALSANTVPENAVNGMVVGTVTGTDPDSGDTKTYSLTNNAGGRFAINSGTGAITVANSTLLNYEAATSHNVTVRVTDRAGLTYNETFTIVVTNVNEAPTGTNATITVNEDTSWTITAANFGFSDVDAGDSMSAVRIDTLPTAGTLTLSGVAVTAGQVVSAADLAAGNLAFTPAANANGTGYANFTFSVRDSNNAYDTAPNTLTINVTAVNDAPTDLSLSASTVAENAANGTVVGTITVTDPDAGDTKSYTLTNSAGGRFAINRTTGVITVANGTLLNYEAATSHAVTVRITDRAGLTYDETFTINLTNVNEAPAGTNNTVTINEDTAQIFTPAHFGFSDVDAGDTLSAVRIDTLPAAGTLTLSGVAVSAGQVVSVADVTAGNLVFTPVANANGAGYARITFSVRDSNNAYDPTPNTLTVNVTAVNDAPVLVVNSGSTVAEGGIDTIGDSELTVTDVDQPGTQLTFSIGVGPAHGHLELTSAPGLSATSFTQADIAGNRLVYVHDGSETTNDSFTFTVSDGAGGTIGSTTVTLTVTPVNDAPTIVSGGGGATATASVAEHVSAVTIVGAVDADLPAQPLTYMVSGGSDQALFVIDAATGTLSFTAPRDFEAPVDSNGDNVYVVQVRVTDSQGASVTQTIHVTVTDVAESHGPANLPPSLVPSTVSSVVAPVSSLVPTRPVQIVSVSEPTAKPVIDAQGLGKEVVAPASHEPTVRSVFRPDEPRPLIESERVRESQGAARDESAASPPLSLSIAESHLHPEEEPGASAQLSDLLFSKLDEVIRGLEEAVAAEAAQQTYVTRIAAASGVTLSVGFVVWALRSTAVLTSLFATIPAWQMLDPLPVVASHRKERVLRKRAQEKVAREELIEYRGLHGLLDEKHVQGRRPPES